MKTFFPNLPVATPTTFLVNVNTLEALPLLQGATEQTVAALGELTVCATWQLVRGSPWVSS